MLSTATTANASSPGEDTTRAQTLLARLYIEVTAVDGADSVKHVIQIARTVMQLCKELESLSEAYLSTLLLSLLHNNTVLACTVPFQVLEWCINQISVTDKNPMLLTAAYIRLLYLLACSFTRPLIVDLWLRSAEHIRSVLQTQIVIACPLERDICGETAEQIIQLCFMMPLQLPVALYEETITPIFVDSFVLEKWLPMLAILVQNAPAQVISSLQSQPIISDVYRSLIKLLSSKPLGNIVYSLLSLLHITPKPMSEKLFNEENMAQTFKLVVQLVQSYADATASLAAVQLMQGLLEKKPWVVQWLQKYQHFDTAIRMLTQSLNARNIGAIVSLINCLLTTTGLETHTLAALTRADTITILVEMLEPHLDNRSTFCVLLLQDNRSTTFLLSNYVQIAIQLQDRIPYARNIELIISTICQILVTRDSVETDIISLLWHYHRTLPCSKTLYDLLANRQRFSFNGPTASTLHKTGAILKYVAQLVHNYLDTERLLTSHVRSVVRTIPPQITQQLKHQLDNMACSYIYELAISVVLCRMGVQDWSATQSTTQHDHTALSTTLLSVLENESVMLRIFFAINCANTREVTLECLIFYIRNSNTDECQLAQRLVSFAETTKTEIICFRPDSKIKSEQYSQFNDTGENILSKQIEQMTMDVKNHASQPSIHANMKPTSFGNSYPLTGVLEQAYQSVVFSLQYQFKFVQDSLKAGEQRGQADLSASQLQNSTLNIELKRSAALLEKANQDKHALTDHIATLENTAAKLKIQCQEQKHGLEQHVLTYARLTENERVARVETSTITAKLEEKTVICDRIQSSLVEMRSELKQSEETRKLIEEVCKVKDAQSETIKMQLEQLKNENTSQRNLYESRLVEQTQHTTELEQLVTTLQSELQEHENEREKHASLVNLLHEVTSKERERGVNASMRRGPKK